MASTLPRLLRSRNVARLLKVPEDWLIAEAKAGRLPHIDAGGVFLFDYEATEQALLALARQATSEAGQ